VEAGLGGEHGRRQDGFPEVEGEVQLGAFRARKGKRGGGVEGIEQTRKQKIKRHKAGRRERETGRERRRNRERNWENPKK
jgi:hypothetical protein